MADKLGLNGEVRELKIGQSFTNPKSTGFHTVKYDFKPASVDTNKIATVDVGSNHQVTVTVPHLDGAGVPHTVFKGSQRPYQKECVLVIDRKTGEITLEKLSSNITVKKTRSELAKPQLPQDKLSQNDKSSISSRSLTPPIVGQRISNRTKVTSGSRRPDRPITHLVQRHSPLQASPSYPPSGYQRSPKNSNNSNEFGNNTSSLSTLPPLIDDYVEPHHLHHNSHSNNHNNISSISSSSSSNNIGNHINSNNHSMGNHGHGGLPQITVTDRSPLHHHQQQQQQHHQQPLHLQNHQQPHQHSDVENGGVGEMSNSSSSSSSDSDSDSDEQDRTLTGGRPTNGVPPAQNSFSRMAVPTHLLNEDLCLSDSGSDSD